MKLERTGLSVIHHLSLLWHQLMNLNMRHIDENLCGQGIKLPARADVTVGMVVSFSSGEVIPGCIGDAFLGVVSSIVAGSAVVILAGSATVQLSNPAACGDFVYARDDGQGQGLTQAAAISGDFPHTRVIGTCVVAGDTSCVVAVRARGWVGALSAAPAVAGEALINYDSGTAATKRPYLLSAGAFTMGGLPVVDSAFSEASNIDTVAVTGNQMRFNFKNAYASLPVTEFSLNAGRPFKMNQYLTTSYVVAKLYDSTGAALNFVDVSGPIHMTARGIVA